MTFTFGMHYFEKNQQILGIGIHMINVTDRHAFSEIVIWMCVYSRNSTNTDGLFSHIAASDKVYLLLLQTETGLLLPNSRAWP